MGITPLEKVQLSKLSLKKKKKKLNIWKQNLVICVLGNKFLNTDYVGQLITWIELSQSFVSWTSYHIVGLCWDHVIAASGGILATQVTSKCGKVHF